MNSATPSRLPGPCILHKNGYRHFGEEADFYKQDLTDLSKLRE
jgi:hypothetical protein